jgi:hypothetical protein
MIRRDHAFYRSTLVRLSFILTGGYLAWLLSPWGPTRLHDTPSLLWLNRILPWWLLALLFAVYTLLLVWGGPLSSIVADSLGAFLYLCEFIALCATAGGHPVNGWAFCSFFLAIAIHFAAARLAMLDYQNRRTHREGR